MIRTQVQLTEAQAQGLKAMAVATDESIAELIRQSVDLFLESRKDKQGARRELRQRAKLTIGQFHSGLPDLGRRHDHYLVDVYSNGRYQDEAEA